MMEAVVTARGGIKGKSLQGGEDSKGPEGEFPEADTFLVLHLW